MSRLKDAPFAPEYKLPPIDYDALINRLIKKNVSYEYALRLFHRSKLTSKESNARLDESNQQAITLLPDMQSQPDVDVFNQKRRRGVFTSGGIVFPEARKAMFLPPTSDERDIQIDTFSETMDYVTDQPNNIDPFKLASWGYLHFVTIHPFGFGNGRVANEEAIFTLRKMGEKVTLPRPLYSKEKKKWKSVLSTVYLYMVGISQDNPDFFSNIEEKSRHDWDVMLGYCQQVKNLTETNGIFPQDEVVDRLAHMFKESAIPLA